MNTAFILCTSILILDTVAQQQPSGWDEASSQDQLGTPPRTVVITSNNENSLKILKIIHGKDEIKKFLEKNPISYQVLGPADPDLPLSKVGQLGQLKVSTVISGKANVIKYLQDGGHQVPAQLLQAGGNQQNRPDSGLYTFGSPSQNIPSQGPTLVNQPNKPTTQAPSEVVVADKPSKQKPTLQRLGSFSGVQDILDHVNANQQLPESPNGDVQHMPYSSPLVTTQPQKPNRPISPWPLGKVGGGVVEGGWGGGWGGGRVGGGRVGGGGMASLVEQVVNSQKLGQVEPSDGSNIQMPVPTTQDDWTKRPITQTVPVDWYSSGQVDIPVTRKPPSHNIPSIEADAPSIFQVTSGKPSRTQTIPVVWQNSGPVRMPVTIKPPSHNIRPAQADGPSNFQVTSGKPTRRIQTIPVVWPDSSPERVPVERKPTGNNMHPIDIDIDIDDINNQSNQQTVEPEPISPESWSVPIVQSNDDPQHQQSLTPMSDDIENNVAKPENSDRPIMISVDEQTEKVTISEADQLGTTPQESPLSGPSNPTTDLGVPNRVFGRNQLLRKTPTGLAEIIDLAVSKKKLANLEQATTSKPVGSSEILEQKPQDQTTSQSETSTSLEGGALGISAANKPIPIESVNSEADGFTRPTLEHPVTIYDRLGGDVTIHDVVDGKVDDVEVKDEGGDEGHDIKIDGDGFVNGFIDSDGVTLVELKDSYRLPSPRRKSVDGFEDGFYDPSGINLLT